VAARVVPVVRALVVALGIAGAVARAQAQAGNAAANDTVTWTAPVGCPSGADLRVRIERRLAAPIDGAIHGVTVTVAIDRTAGEPRFVARIGLGAAGAAASGDRRVLTSARCDELADAVALVIARIAAEAPPPAAEPRPVEPGSRRAAPEPRPWGGGLRLEGLSGIGALPGVSVAGGVAGYVRKRSLFVELAAMRWLPGTQDLRGGEGPEIHVSLDAMAVRIGWSPEDLPLRAWLAGELGALRGESLADPAQHMTDGRWIAAGAGFAVAWPVLHHARLVGTIDVAVPTQRVQVVTSDGSALYQSGPVSVRSGLGLEVGWW